MDYKSIKEGDLLEFVAADRQMGLKQGTFLVVLALKAHYANCYTVLRLDTNKVVYWHHDNLANFCALAAST